MQEVQARGRRTHMFIVQPFHGSVTPTIIGQQHFVTSRWSVTSCHKFYWIREVIKTLRSTWIKGTAFIFKLSEVLDCVALEYPTNARPILFYCIMHAETGTMGDLETVSGILL